MKIVALALLFYGAIDDNADKGRPHVDKIQAVEAMGDNQKICSKGGAVGVCSADDYYQNAGETADRGIEKGA